MTRFRFAALLAFTISLARAEPLLMRTPTLNATHIVFSYAGDLWSVPRAGGDARRLTTGPGIETEPRFSPDGKQIAFTGEYDGNLDVFVMPASGGVPKRLTYHPGWEFTAGWTPDGKRVLFASSRAVAMDGGHLFTIAAEGGFPEPLPFPMSFEGSYSADGSRLAYSPLFQWQPWKRYRGGQTLKIWIANLTDSSVVEIPRQNSNDANPIWIGDTIYFLSDRDGPFTLFSYDTRSRQVKRLIENRGVDFKSASAGPGAIVYEQFGSLHLYDLRTGATTPVPVRLAGDFSEVRPRLVNVSKRLGRADLSPNGARAVFEARGEILTVPAEKGDARVLTNTPGVMERDPVWSPDGKTIAYFSDESGEYALHLRDQSGLGEATRISLGDKPAFYFAPAWSPDSRKIAYFDHRLGLWYVDVEQKKPVLVDTAYYRFDRDQPPVWSPDSRWLAYPKQLKSHLSAIHIYSVSDARTTQVTDGMSDAAHPVFDKSGKHLYFVASTDSGPAKQPDLHRGTRTATSNIYLAVLGKDQPSPLAPESDDEKKAEEPAKIPAAIDVGIDFDNIGQRIIALPMPARNYRSLHVGKAGVLYAVEDPPGGDSGLRVHRYDLTNRKSDIAASGVNHFQVSFNGEKSLHKQGDRWFITAPPPMADPSAPPPPPADPAKGALKTETLEIRSEPRAEWRQMFREAWRLQRDFFYDSNYHGLDLKAAEKRWEPYLENIVSRRDLNYLFIEMMQELSVSHLYIGGGDTPEVKPIRGGLLGADYKIDNGRYRFDRVYNGENWNPDLKAPLTQPGVNVAAGEYLLAVNGRDLRAADNIYSFFEATAGKSVTLRVGADPSGAGAREVTVTPVDDEHRLRHLAWIEDNRRKVDQMTNGRVAYIHMPDTAQSGSTSFNRYFFAQVGKEAAIIDDRFNHGGQLATDLIEYLRRPMMSLITFRHGADWVQPQGAIFGPKVMLINEFGGSGGDLLPWYFRRAGLGKLIGKRTWGGVVGNFEVPGLLDGGGMTAPGGLVWSPDGEYVIENQGVAPDIEVELDPKAVREGRDPQLEMAVKVVLEDLAKNPVPQPKRPAYPNFQR